MSDDVGSHLPHPTASGPAGSWRGAPVRAVSSGEACLPGLARGIGAARDEPTERRLAPASWAIPAALGALTVLVFLPVLRNDFVGWDDAGNLLQNPDYRGLGWAQLRWMFTTMRLNHYVPLTWLSFGFDYVVWGMNPAGYHLTNLLLHVADVVLFYLVARALLGKATTFSTPALTTGSVVAALLFGIHPLRAESVAWVTERRDVLSGALFLAAVLSYLRATEARGASRRRRLAGSVILYALAFMAKSIVMTLPLTLLLLDVYPLRRLAPDPRRWAGPEARKVLLEKLPYAAISVAGSATAYFAQIVVQDPMPYAHASWIWRLTNVAYSLWFYVSRTAVPVALSPLYETPVHPDPLEPRFVMAAVGALGLTLLALVMARRWPAGLAAWAYYGIVLAPVSGIIPLGVQVAANRYSYLVCLGWAVLAGAGAAAVHEAARRGLVRRPLVRLVAGAGAAAFLTLGTLTWQQVRIWRDNESLWRYAVTVMPDCGHCHGLLGAALMERNASLGALEHFLHAVALRPDRPELQALTGIVYGRLGMWAQAVERYRMAVEAAPQRVGFRVDLARALDRAGRPAEAVARYREALRLDPGDPEARLGLGFALNGLDRFVEAAEQFERVIEARPRSATARLGLVRAYAGLGRKDVARAENETLRALSPEIAARVDPRWLSD